MKTTNTHVTHGEVLEENSLLSEFFGPSPHKIVTAAKKDLNALSLEELQNYAEDLGILPEDNKSNLLLRIKRFLKT